MAVARRLLPPRIEEVPVRIAIMGVGNCGTKTINSLAGAGVEIAKLIAVDTDINSLRNVRAHENIQIGENTVRGRGTGAEISKGKASAEEDADKVIRAVGEMDLLIAIAGLGGGTGSGALPFLLASLREAYPEMAVISVVTLPFRYEGSHRLKNAQAGLREIVIYSDCTIVNLNDILLEKYGEMPITEAYRRMDALIMKTVKSMVDMMDPRDAVHRVDFPDLVSIVRRSGVGFVGHGSHRSIRRALEAAINSRLLDADPSTATGALIYMSIPSTITLTDMVEGPRLLTEKFGIEKIAMGARVKELLRIPEVMVIATGVESRSVTDLIGDVRELLKE